MAQTGEDCRLSDIRTGLAKAWPLIVAEVRAAVVAEIRDDGLDVDLTPEEERRWSEYARGEREEHRRVLGILRALLPPVSAPGPTLPPLPGNWTPYAHGDRIWAIQDGDECEPDTRMVTLYQPDGLVDATVAGTPMPELLAVLAYLASRAERGPDAGGEG